MNTHMQGFLGFIAGVCGVVAAVSYGALCRRLSLRSLLVLCLTVLRPTVERNTSVADPVRERGVG